MSKGSRRRPEDTEAYRSNYDRVFGNSDETMERAIDLMIRLHASLGPSCRDPLNCTGSCVRDPACNE